MKHVEGIIDEEFPSYESAIKDIDKYYDMNLVSFVAYDSILYVHIPIFLKLRDQPVLYLFQVENHPIPYDPADLKPSQTGEWIGAYTQVELEKEFMAIGKEIYLSFNQKELDTCKKIGGLYYCESVLLLKHC